MYKSTDKTMGRFQSSEVREILFLPPPVKYKYFSKTPVPKCTGQRTGDVNK
jgi:hypothetical protein